MLVKTIVTIVIKTNFYPVFFFLGLSNKENVSTANQSTPPTSSSPVAPVAVVKMEVDSDVDTKAVDSNASNAVNSALNATKEDDCCEERYVHSCVLFFSFLLLHQLAMHKFDCCELNSCNDCVRQSNLAQIFIRIE